MDQPPINPYNAGPAHIPSPLAPGSTMASPTSIEFALDLEDYLAWNWHKVNSIPRLVRQFRTIWVVIPLLCFIADVFVVRQLWGGDLVELVMFSSILPVIGIAYAIMYPSRYRNAVRKNAVSLYSQSTNRALHGHRRMEISPAGIYLTGEFFESLLRWPLIVRIDVSEQYAFFDTGGLGGIIVPRAAFTQDAAFQAFIAAARRYQQAAQDADRIHPEVA
jgi:hypothetical protein